MTQPFTLRRTLLACLMIPIALGPLPLYAQAAAPSFTPAKGDRWCAIGDSITHARGYVDLLYLFALTRHPATRFELFNCGAGGDTAFGTLNRRMETDILVHTPTRATVMLGINDIWWQHSGQIGPDDYIRDISLIVDRLQKKRADVILITPPPYDATAQGKDALEPRRAGLERYVDQLRALSAKRKIPLVDVNRTLVDITKREQAKNPGFSLMKMDRIHLEEIGSFLVADTILRGMKAQTLVSRATIDARAGAPKAENAAIGKFTRANGAISFSLLEKALPFPPSAIPAGSVPLTNFAQDLNQQLLQVRNLAEGKYELKIDDQIAGTYTAADLAKGINLAGNPATPQNQQAETVAALVMQRGAIISDKLRHITMIEYGELKKPYPVDDAKSPATDLEGSGRSYPEYFSLKPHQSQFIREAQELDDRIWKSNQPVVHHWQLTPAK